MTREEKEERIRWKIEEALKRHFEMVAQCSKHASRAVDSDEKDLNKKEVVGWIKDCQTHLSQAAQIMEEL